MRFQILTLSEAVRFPASWPCGPAGNQLGRVFRRGRRAHRRPLHSGFSESAPLTGSPRTAPDRAFADVSGPLGRVLGGTNTGSGAADLSDNNWFQFRWKAASVALKNGDFDRFDLFRQAEGARASGRASRSSKTSGRRANQDGRFRHRHAPGSTGPIHAADGRQPEFDVPLLGLPQEKADAASARNGGVSVRQDPRSRTAALPRAAMIAPPRRRWSVARVWTESQDEVTRRTSVSSRPAHSTGPEFSGSAGSRRPPQRGKRGAIPQPAARHSRAAIPF